MLVTVQVETCSECVFPPEQLFFFQRYSIFFSCNCRLIHAIIKEDNFWGRKNFLGHVDIVFVFIYRKKNN